MHKECAKCHILKPLSEFNFKNKKLGRLNARCKSCTRKDIRNAYYKNREYYLDYRAKINHSKRIKISQFIHEFLLHNPCIDCGVAEPEVLHFDHIHGQKKMEISKMRNGRYSLQAVVDEINKCVVRCANCHARKTAAEQGWYKYLFAPEAIANVKITN